MREMLLKRIVADCGDYQLDLVPAWCPVHCNLLQPATDNRQPTGTSTINHGMRRRIRAINSTDHAVSTLPKPHHRINPDIASTAPALNPT
eukprot:scaffold19318_cov22-Cyclotella_meneghiniana.AAC.2